MPLPALIAVSQLALAMLKVARKNYCCYYAAPIKPQALEHIFPYMRTWPPPTDSEADGGTEQLAAVLWQYTTACSSPISIAMEAMHNLVAVAESLAAPRTRRRLQCQLE